MRVLTLMLLMLAGAARGQGLEGPPLGPPPFLDELFVPRLVMEHQTEIGLTAEQRDAITREMAATQKKVVDVRWALEEKSEALKKLLAAERVDEAAALARAKEVLDLEQQIKQAHLTLLMRIKNQLTAAQQAKLRELRPRGGHGPGRPFPGRPPEE